MALNTQTGILTSVKNTTISTFAIGENTTGLLSDILVVGREYMKPTFMEAKVETLAVMAEGIKELVDRGISEAEARQYLEVALA